MTIFEEVSSKVNKKDFNNLDEFCVYWCRGDRCATVNFPSGSKLYNKVKKLAAEYSEIQIHSDHGGVLVAEIPVKYIRITAPRVLSDEQREKAARNLKEYKEHLG